MHFIAYLFKVVIIIHCIELFWSCIFLFALICQAIMQLCWCLGLVPTQTTRRHCNQCFPMGMYISVSAQRFHKMKIEQCCCTAGQDSASTLLGWCQKVDAKRHQHSKFVLFVSLYLSLSLSFSLSNFSNTAFQNNSWSSWPIRSILGSYERVLMN